MAGYSVVILTLNEEKDLPGCLASVEDCDDVVILDSGSRDRTTEIAQRAGARVFTRQFDSFGRQRNFAQREIRFRHSWVFHLDADEKFTPELAKECSMVAAGNPAADGYYVAPKMLWENQWIPHCTDFPAWQARFVRVPEFEFIDVGHGQRESQAMRMRHLEANYLHDLSSGGEAEWLEKHRRYARAEAREFHFGQNRLRLSAFVARDRLIRRRALKRLSYHLPFRPTIRFIYQFIFRRGFLDGAAGLRYCRLLAQYEGFVVDELQRIRAEST
jgi:glycosyltransferase involved in cell wall biosynthesis